MTITYRGECIINDIKTIKSILSTLKEIKTKSEHTNEEEEYLKNVLKEICSISVIVDEEKSKKVWKVLDKEKREIVRSDRLDLIILFTEKINSNT